MIKFWLKLFFSQFMLYEDDGAGGGGAGGAGGEGGDGGEGGTGGEGGDPGAGGKGAWPDDWRQNIAGDDEKALNQLSRYASPVDIWNKARALEQRVSSGELKSAEPFPENGTDEEKTRWRTENNVPAEAKYELSLPEGFVIGEADQPVVDGFMEFAHAKNLPTPVVNDVVSWYFNNQEALAEARSEQDLAIQEASTDELRGEWGDGYRTNINRINGLMDTAPQEVKEAMLSARLADGTPLASSAGVLRFLNQLAHEINPATTIVPGQGQDQMNNLADEIAEIETLMGNRQSEYYKGPKAEKLQQRYRDLVSARDKLSSKNAA
jgi:hypothetical protein